MAIIDWSTGWPDWMDAGRSVIIQAEGGSTVEAVLEIEDQFFDGEEEIPLFIGRTAGGERIDFAGAERWRFAA